MAGATRLARVREGLRLELRPMVALAWPVVAAELGWMAMGLVDTMMVGRVGAEAIGAVSVGANLFFTVAIFGIGMLLGLDYMVARAFGAGRAEDMHRALVHGIALATGLAIALTGLIFAGIPYLPLLGMQESVVRAAEPYLRAVTWSMWPLLLYSALRQYLQAMGLVKPVMVAFISANLINVVADWALVFGHLGLPALGAEGAGWATTISRLYMALVLLWFTLRHDRRSGGALRRTPVHLEWARLAELVRLGVPAALQRVLEVGVFAAATVLAGRLDAAALAAHQIALSLASFTFMVPLGVSGAAAVRVGQALGRGERAAAARAGWTALLLGALFMLGAGLTFIGAPRVMVRIFTSAPAVIDIGVSLLAVAALFQLFDGLQVVANGALRGLGDTRTPMIANLLGHWLLGLPVGYALCFWWGLGVVGLWVGLSVGLIAVALALVRIWGWRMAENSPPPLNR